MTRRPPAVTIVAWVYIAAGAVGFMYHAPELSRNGLGYDVLGVEIVRLIAVLAGVFILRGRNWARWVALAWITFHAAVSAFHTPVELAVHCAFLALTAWLLFRTVASRYFRGEAGAAG